MAGSVDRAYSLLDIKSIDDDERIIAGIASSPLTDRVGDVLEPTGAEFRLPLPLLWQHRADEPIGQVLAAKVSASGIEIRAQIAKNVLPRIDEIWALIKARLVRGLSVGFRPTADPEPIKGTSGLRFPAWEWLELSAVTIPANADASIQTVKQCDTSAAAPGGRRVVSVLPGAPGSRGHGSAMKPYAEQITSFEHTRAAKVAERDSLQEKASSEGRTKDAAERESFETLTQEIKAIDDELVDLRALEQTNRQMAAPVTGGTPEQGAASRTPVITVKDTLPPGIEFARYVMCLAAARGNTSQAVEIAKARYPDMTRIATVLKSAVAAGTTTDPQWAGALVDYTNFTGDFIEYLRPATIIGKFGTNGIPALRPVPFNIRIIGQTSGGEGYWVGQGQPKPLTSFDFAPTLLTWAKVANIAVLSDELVRFSSPSAEALVRDALRGALVARLDIDFVNPNKAAVANVSPASITNGISPIASSGTDAAAVRADIAAIFSTFIAANLTPANGVWIMSATTALQLSLMRNALGQKEFPTITMMGGTFEGLPVIVSEHVAVSGSPDNHIVILVNASDIYLSDDGQVVIDASREASLQMDDAPTNASASGSPLAPVPTQVVSMFQTNSVALRAERYINWARRRVEAVAYLEGVNWAA